MTEKVRGIPSWPISDEKEKMAMKEVLDSGSWWRNGGIQTKEFEKEFAAYQGAVYGITAANGTQALEIALKALGIGSGDEVIVPDFTFFSTVSCVLEVGAVPVLVDVRPDTFCMDVCEVEKAVTPKTRAIIPVHMAGNIADMDRINSIAGKYGLSVVEDAAHAHGACWGERGAGTLGDVGIFSFQNAKLMSAGEGGAIISDDKELIDKAFLELNCGRAENDTTYQHVRVGTNARLSEMQGAILRVQLSRLREQTLLREKNYVYLEKRLKTISGITLQKIDERTTTDSHYMVMFYYDEKAFGGVCRDEFVAYLRGAGIPCNRSFEAIHNLPVLQTLPKEQWKIQGECQVSEKISREVVCLNHNVLLGNIDTMDDIVEVICRFQVRVCGE